MSQSELKTSTMDTKEKDPRVQTQQYLEQHKIKELLQLLVAELLYHKPQDPKQYIVTYLERTKVAGTKPLFNKQDLHTMFEMFDITRKGVVTQQQASNAITSMLGSKVQEGLPAVEEPSEQMRQKEFVDYLSNAVIGATPLCNAAMLD